MKKIAVFLLSAVVALSLQLSTYAEEDTNRFKFERVKQMGFFNTSTVNENDMVTREQFARILIGLNGLEFIADSSKNKTNFYDVEPTRWSSGFINAVTEKGLMAPGIDGGFHPSERILYSQVCYIFLKELGYVDADMPGIIPYNYIYKAHELGLTYKPLSENDEEITRYECGIMIDKLLQAHVKPAAGESTQKTYADYKGVLTPHLIIGKHSTDNSIEDGYIVTNKGKYVCASDINNLEVGKKYSLTIRDGKIVKALSLLKNMKTYCITGFSDGSIYYNNQEGSGILKLPENIEYFYKGSKIELKGISEIVKPYTSVVFELSDNKGIYESAYIIDPVYSTPQVVTEIDKKNMIIGVFDLHNNPSIVKDGKMANFIDIEKYDVLCRISDFTGKESIINDSGKYIEGEITGILPDKTFPKKIQINKVDYEFNEYMDYSKINGSINSYCIGDRIIAPVGYNGKIVDLLSPGAEDTSSYAFVINYDEQRLKTIEDGNKVNYTVKLMLSDGTSKTFKVDNSASSLKGSLVKYKITEFGKSEDDALDKVVLETVKYNTGLDENISINKENKSIGSYLVTDNIKVFNIITSESIGTDTDVKVLRWSDLKSGEIEGKSILHINKVGDFDDVNIIIAKDILQEKSQMAVIVKNEESLNGDSESSYSVLVDGKTLSLFFQGEYYPGNVMMIDFRYGVINSDITGYRKLVPDVEADTVQAVSWTRIKVNNNVYRFCDDVSIYINHPDGKVVQVGINDISLNHKYSKVELYHDKATLQSGRVKTIVITE